MNKATELENRLIEFSSSAINISMDLKESVQGKNLASQLSRSASSVSLNYGEAQAGESIKDFIHKMKIVLKELRETHICLRLIKNSSLYIGHSDLIAVISESNELISIFVTSIKTARKNSNL